MAVEFPTDSINKLQITLRKQANIPPYFYNHEEEDPTFQKLPSVQEAIESLYPSLPPYLRCKQCQGGLLRGLQSIICVFCGAQQEKQITPDPICFNTTFGYRWLLQSLDLDGSEPVGASYSNKGLNASKDAMVLSDLLNIEIKWPADSEKSGNDSANKAPNLMKNPLNVSGVDLDSFFSETKKENVFSMSEEQLMTNKVVKFAEALAPPSQNNLSLFENTQSSEALSRPTAGAVDDPFSGWEDEFQSAGVRTLPVESKSLDFFSEASPIEFSSSLETAVGLEAETKFGFDSIRNNVKENTTSVPHVSMNDSWVQDDQWHASNIVLSTKTAQVQIKIEGTKVGEPTDKTNSISSLDNNLFQDDLWQTGPEKHREDDNSFDVWQDFTSSGSALDPSPSSLRPTSTSKTSTDASDKKLVSSSHDFQELEFGSFMSPDLFSGGTSINDGSTAMNIVKEGSISDRLVEVNVRGVKSTENANNSFDAAMWAESADNTVETLMSQMHDLSFMLDGNLSIPKKENGIDSLSWN